MNQKPRSLILHPFEVRGILAGTLTQIRRPVKSKGPFDGPLHPAVQRIDHRGGGWFGFEASEAIKQQYSTTFPLDTIRCPLGKVGDLVIGKETWCKHGYEWGGHFYIYKATDCLKTYHYVKWKSATQMPLEASRITLRLESIRVQRVQEMTHRDALDTGIEYDVSEPEGAPLHQYRKVWNSIYARRGHGWDSNPWVWVWEVERV